MKTFFTGHGIALHKMPKNASLSAFHAMKRVVVFKLKFSFAKIKRRLASS